MPDPVSLTTLVIAAVAAITLTVFALVLAALLDRSGPIRIRHWVEKAGGDLRELFDRRVRFEAFRYVLGFLARAAPAVLAALLALLLVPILGMVPAGLWALAIVLVVVLLAEALSRFLARDAEPSLDRLTFAYRGLLILTRPLLPLASIPFANHDAEAALNGVEDGDATDDEIEAFLDVGAREGILEPGEEEIIQRIIDFGDEVVRAVMTPRIDMVCAPMETPLEDLASLFVSSNHSRIPIYVDSVDRIKGVLHIRDLLGALRKGAPVELEKLMMPPHFVPETKPLTSLLSELQARHVHMALVVDEYGGTAGLVTIEDLLEEIVGEIIDEHDEDEFEAEDLGDGRYRLEGMTSLDTLGEIFERDFGDEPYETVGGMVFGLIGDLPEVGQSVAAHGLRFTVEQTVDRRVETLVVSSESSKLEGNEPA